MFDLSRTSDSCRAADPSAGARGDHHLDTVQLHLTSGCNLRCSHCYLAAGERGTDELDLGAWERVLAGFPDSVRSVELTGGEPTSIPWLLKLAELLKARGFRLSLFTNGTLLTPALTRRIGVLFSSVFVSVDGLAPAHDAFRGMPGAFARTVAGINLLAQTELEVGINITMTDESINGLRDLLEFLSSLDVDVIRLAKVMPFGRSQQGFEVGAASVSALQAQIARAIASTAQDVEWDLQVDLPDTAPAAPLCGAGISSCSVRPNGDVFPCSTLAGLEFRAGSVRERSLADIWASPESELLVALRRTRVRDITADCPADCPALAFCAGGCRAVAYFAGQDFAAPEAGACAMLLEGLTRGLLSTRCAPCAPALS